jgi:hypothetical protein
VQARSFHEGAAAAERFFMGEGEVYKALLEVCAALDADGIPYAVVGAMALNAYGYRRMTTDVDLLLTREGLAAFKAKRIGLGWVERFPGSKGMRDTEHRVGVVLIAGEYPGDGAPKPVRFPDPSVAVDAEGVKVLPLERLIELKLASGLSAAHRGKDLVDVQELIRYAALPLALASSLDASVRDEYRNRWHLAQASLKDDA